MSRSGAIETLSPFSLALGQHVYAEDLAAIASALAYAGARCPQVLASFVSGRSGWGPSGLEPGTHDALIEDSSYVTLYTFRVYVDPDAQAVRVITRVEVDNTDNAKVRVTVGGATPVVHSVTAAGSPLTVENDDDIDTADTGTGLIEVKIEVELTSGVGPAELEAFTLRELPIDDADLPAPP